MSTLEQSVHQATEACLNGAKLPIIATEDEKLVNSQLRAAVKANLPVFDRVYMDRCEKGYSEGFDAAIGGKLDFAKRAFEMAEGILESKPLYYESKLLSKSFLRAAQAYLDYALHDFTGARNRLQDAIECDEILENQFGYTILHIHRVHLVENIMRNEFQAGNRRDAFLLARDLLLYLAGIGPALPVPGKWGQDQLARVAPEVVRSKLVGITADIAQFLAQMTADEARTCFALVALPLDAGNPEYRQADVLEWFALKKMFFHHEPASFLLRAAAFLEQGPRAVPMLWTPVALDVVTTCEALPDTETARKKILVQAVNWGFVPRKLRLRFVEKAEALQLIATAPGA